MTDTHSPESAVQTNREAAASHFCDRATFTIVAERRSVRGFKADPVDDSTIDAILAGASRAPSAQNMQPWRVHVVTGKTKDLLTEEVSSAVLRGERSDEYNYLPEKIVEPYLARRRKVGLDLFAIYGIDRDDIDGRTRAYLRNFAFFGAPLGLFFVIERTMSQGAWLDCGAFMQNVMILARAAGLETCPQQSWCDHGAVVHRVLGIPEDQILVSGMAVGFMDAEVAANRLRTERAPVEEFTIRHR